MSLASFCHLAKSREYLKPDANSVNVDAAKVSPPALESNLMYVTEILARCSEFAARTARVYRHLSERHAGDPGRVSLWHELALEEEIHADVLRRELQSFQEQDHSGTFLPDFADRLHHVDHELRQLERRAESARTLDDALAVAVALEQTDLEDLYDDLVLQGEPAFRLISERIEAALAVRPERTPAAGLARRTRRTPS